MSGSAPQDRSPLLARAVAGALALSLCACEPQPPPGPRGLEVRTPVSRFLKFPADLGRGAYRAVETFPNLRFDWAVRAVHQPRGDRWFVIEREGRLWSFPNDQQASRKTLALDLSKNTQGFYDCGLLGLAFHPLFGQPGSRHAAYLYLWYNYTERPQGSRTQRPRYKTPSYNRLSRFELKSPDGVVDPASELVLIDQHNETTFHEGGAMLFHPDDGFLYLTLGDDFETEKAQRLDGGLFSGIVRLDVDQDPRRSHPIRRQPQGGRSQHYFIPNDNPWVDASGKQLEEFWALGLRSPHVMSLDPPTGRLFVADVGHMLREELSVLPRGVAGANFEWPVKEGREGAEPQQPLLGKRIAPVLDYPHAEGDNCIIGGFVYRGRAFPELVGRYLFGDNGSNRVWALELTPSGAGERRQIAKLLGPAGYAGGLSSVSADPQGEAMLVRVGANASLYRLAPAEKDKASVPRLLSETGLFADVRSLQPAPGVVPYDVNVPHWTDGARARHFLALPNDGDGQWQPEREQLHFAPEGEWSVPKGAVLAQHLELPRDGRDPLRPRSIETRVLVHGRDDFYALSYRWREDGSDADLVPPGGAGVVELPVPAGPGMPRTQSWAYLSRGQCRQCHNPLAGTVLGLSARQLNLERAYVRGRDHQVRALGHAGYLSTAPSERELRALARLLAIDDEQASLEPRVRSYLDVNCAPCHRPEGTRARFDARLLTPLNVAGIVNGEAVDPLGVPGARIVKPRDLGASVLLMRMYAVGMQGLGMPPVGKLQADHKAAEAVRRWILELEE